jgi:hypothetical protein
MVRILSASPPGNLKSVPLAAEHALLSRLPSRGTPARRFIGSDQWLDLIVLPRGRRDHKRAVGDRFGERRKPSPPREFGRRPTPNGSW